MDARHIIFMLVFYVACGTFISMGFLKRREVGRRYYLFHGLTAALFLIFVYALSGPTGLETYLRPYFYIFLTCSVLFSLFAGNGNAFSSWVVLPSYFFGLCAALLVITGDSLAGHPPSPLHYGGKSPFVVNSVLSMLLLGFAVAALLVGRWRIFLPINSFRGLRRISYILFLLVIARFAFGTYSISQALAGKTDAEAYRYFLSATTGILIFMRLCWGLVGPLLLTMLLWTSVKVRTPQLATGVLYVTALCVLAGETLSRYLALFHGIPL